MNDKILEFEREKKHRQIMNLIHTYKHSPEEIKKLERIKNNTTMEINLRFLQSKHNREYRFPLSPQSDEDTEEQFPSGTILYDLHSQTSAIKKSVSSKILSLDQSRRIKSLERTETDRKRINPFKPKLMDFHRKPPDVQNYVERKNSLLDRKQNLSVVRLPQLNKKEKSQKRIHLQEVVGKKMLTQESPNHVKMSKYINNALKHKKAQMKTKKFFMA